MLTVEQILEVGGNLAVTSIKNDVSKISATGKTRDSVRFVVFKYAGAWHLQIRGRKFFKAIETGRGPRKGTEYQKFDISILDYMKARGIGSDLSEKKRANLARFIALKINKEGDSVFKQGGRQVYSDNLDKIIDKIKQDIRKQFTTAVITDIKHEFNRN